MTKSKTTLDVAWSLPDGNGGFKKRAFAHSTRADSDLLSLVAHHTQCTWSDMLKHVHYPSLEIRQIVDGMCKAGFGDVIAAKHLRSV